MSLSNSEKTSEIRRLRGAIELEYLAIGKKYFNSHSNEDTGDYREEIAKIKMAIQRLNKLECN